MPTHLRPMRWGQITWYNKHMKALKQFWYGQVIERITGRIFSGDYDYKGRPFFAGDTFKRQICYRGVWSYIGKITVVERICHPSVNKPDAQLYSKNKISFWWTTTRHTTAFRNVKQWA